MAVADVVAACRARAESVQRRNEQIRALVADYQARGMGKVAAMEQVAADVQAAMRADGWTDGQILGAGVSYGNVRVICGC